MKHYGKVVLRSVKVRKMKHYVRIVSNLIFIVFSMGFIGPLLVSAPNDIAVIGGWLYILLVVPAVLYYINRNYVKSLMEKL
jgi:hypothetical protein